MKVLGVDAGAVRAGYAVIEPEGEGYKYHGSGIISTKREPEEPFQEYRLRLIKVWVSEAEYVLDAFHPELVITETVPAVSATNFSIAGQSYLAHAQITTVHAVAYLREIEVEQISATTVKKRLTGKGGASKVQVRNAVLSLMPELGYKREEWIKMKVHDESDALGIALSKLLKKGRDGRKEATRKVTDGGDSTS